MANKLNREQMLLIIAAEECNEVAQRISKALRFGLEEVQAGQALTNAERINYEMNDLLCTFNMMFTENILPLPRKEDQPAKKEKIEEYFKLSQKLDVME